MLTWATLFIAVLSLTEAYWIYQLHTRANRLEADYKQLLDIERHSILRQLDAKALVEGTALELLTEIHVRGEWLKRNMDYSPGSEYFNVAYEVAHAAHEWASLRIKDSSRYAQDKVATLLEVKSNAYYAMKAVEEIRSGRPSGDFSGLLGYMKKITSKVASMVELGDTSGK